MPFKKNITKGHVILVFAFFLCVFPVSSREAHARQGIDYAWTKVAGDSTSLIGTESRSIAHDSSGNVYITGRIGGTVDFDLGPGVEELTRSDAMFLAKYDNDGEYQWAVAIGDGSWGLSVAVDSFGNVYVAGDFSNTVDFNPGAGVENHASHGRTDFFVSKYTSSGDYEWTNAIGGDWYDVAFSVATNSFGDVLVGGYFSAPSVDFGGIVRTTGDQDGFIAKYNSNGTLATVATQSGGEVDSVVVDDLDNVFAFGMANYEPMIAGYYGSLAPWWMKTFSTTAFNNIYISSVGTNVHGSVYVTGSYSGTIDFDPGTGTDEKTNISTDHNTFFFSKFDSDGDYLWTEAGTGDHFMGSQVIVNSDSSVMVRGRLYGTVDFDLGSGVDERTGDAFLTKYSLNGDREWTETAGAMGHMTLDNSGNIFHTESSMGVYSSPVDFDFTRYVKTYLYSGFSLTKFVPNRYSQGPSDMIDGSTVFDSTPTLTFSLSACQSGNLQYRIQIDDDPMYASPIVDYTSGPVGAGGNFFTVGQPENGGSYAAGNEGQELSEGAYYWRISSLCGAVPSPWSHGGDNFTVSPTLWRQKVNAQLDINATISLSCDPSVTMNALVGTGRSNIDTNNRADCTVMTNSSAGYGLSWQASSDDLLNSQSDHFVAYPPAASTTPEIWDIPNTTSAWGAKLASTSMGYNGGSGGGGYSYPGIGWGSDDSYGNGRWLNVAAAEPFQFMQKATETDVDGELQSLMFAAEIGGDKIQPTGAYSTNVTVTAVTLAGGGGEGSYENCSAHYASYGDTVVDTLDTGDCQESPAGPGWYSEVILFSGSEGDKITLDASWPASTGSLTLVDDSDSAVVWQNGDWNNPASLVSGYVTLPTTGTYTIWVTTGDEGEVGGYSVTLDRHIPATCTEHSASYGDTVNGTLDIGDCQEDPYAPGYYDEKILFSGTAGDKIQFDATWDDSTGNLFLVNDADYSVIWGNGDSNDPASLLSNYITLPTTGTYTLWVTTTIQGEVGDYSVTLQEHLPVACTEHSAAYGDTVNGTLDIGDCQEDPYAPGYYDEKILFSGTAGDKVILDASWPDSTGYLYLVSDIDNSIVWSDGDWNTPASKNSGNITLPVTGSYTLWVTTADLGEVGDYSVTIISGNYGLMETVVFDGQNQATPSESIPNGGGEYGITVPGRWVMSFETPYGERYHPRQTRMRIVDAFGNIANTYTYDDGSLLDSVFVKEVSSEDLAVSGGWLTWGYGYQKYDWYGTNVHLVRDDPGKDVDMFFFTDVSQASPDTIIVSPPLPVTGVAGSYSVSVSGDGSPEMQIGGSGAWGTSGSISVGESIRLRTTSGSGECDLANVSVTIGDMSGQWTVRSYCPN